MSRKPRARSQSGYYHFINRGINKKNLFHHDEDNLFYWGLLTEYSRQLEVRILHYCFMSNHSHLLVYAAELPVLSSFGHFIQRRYAYYYAKTYHWNEQLFKKPFLSIPIDTDTYLLECARYIERNPLKANLVKDPSEYPYSSYGFYARGQENALISPNSIYNDLGNNEEERRASYRAYVCQPRLSEVDLVNPF